MPAIDLSLPRGRGLFLAAIIGCALAITACGSSGGSGTNAGGAASKFLAFSECMRSHGLSSFPDPDASGGLNLDGTHLNPFSPAFRAAQTQCHKLLPGGGPPEHVSEQQKERLVQTSECMRAHGISGFPDPTTSPPTSPKNYSVIEGIGGLNGGLFLLVPRTIDVNSPAFKQAQNACSFR